MLRSTSNSHDDEVPRKPSPHVTWNGDQNCWVGGSEDREKGMERKIWIKKRLFPYGRGRRWGQNILGTFVWVDNTFLQETDPSMIPWESRDNSTGSWNGRQCRIKDQGFRIMILSNLSGLMNKIFVQQLYSSNRTSWQRIRLGLYISSISRDWLSYLCSSPWVSLPDSNIDSSLLFQTLSPKGETENRILTQRIYLSKLWNKKNHAYAIRRKYSTNAVTTRTAWSSANRSNLALF